MSEERAQISMSNTKKDMLKAYKALRGTEEELRESEGGAEADRVTAAEDQGDGDPAEGGGAQGLHLRGDGPRHCTPRHRLLCDDQSRTIP